MKFLRDVIVVGTWYSDLAPAFSLLFTPAWPASSDPLGIQPGPKAPVQLMARATTFNSFITFYV